MLAFRSEAHVDSWCEARRIPRGASFTLEQSWLLGEAWYGDKLSQEWQRLTSQEAERTFASIGLTGAFWRLT
jgi:hypothetical protein